MKKENIKTLQQCLEVIEGFQTILETMSQIEQETFDELSDTYQNSEKGITHQEQLDCLQEAVDNLNEIISNCYSVIDMEEY